MFKTVSKAIRAGTAPFQRGAFFCASDCKYGFSRLPAREKEDHARPVAWFFFLTTKSYLKEVHKLRLKNKLQTPAPAGKKTGRRFSPAKVAYCA